ncbi:HEPN/Toprim-associated domain-containing protein [Archangium violaceum]|uniref:HEPN/Toprim-associated domain-containing protein n=1 Tax=Archangium violaceum TaxID=83451 RepID=UPI0036DC7029
MGTYVTLRIAGHEILSTKNSINNAVMTLFVEQDKVARSRGRTMPLAEFFDSQQRGELEEPFLGYETYIHIARDRMEVMGYTMARVRELFEEAMQGWREEHENTHWDSDGLTLEQDLISSVHFDDWLEALGAVLEAKASEHDYEQWRTCHRLAPFLLGDLILADDWLLGFPTDDCRPVIRAALELFPDKELVIQDLTDALHSEWSIVRDNICEQARENLSFDYPLSQKTIILTEGTSDAWILSGAMKVLFPHLVEYFSFMDFDNARIQGGAGSLVQIVKAFAAAGVANRVVALFDNDTGAEEALAGLKEVRLPKNIKIVKCPQIELARSYPSIGPTGLQFMDVNGLAASIEMYLGEDVLRDESGELTPVQWRGYSDKLRKYQGEIIGKDKVKSRFREKLKTAPSQEVAHQLPEWQALKLLLRGVLTAFG